MISFSFTRIGCGFFQVFCYIYFPVWVDEFGVSDHRAIWISFLQLGVPLGTMIGYVAEAGFISASGDVRLYFFYYFMFISIVAKSFLFTNLFYIDWINSFSNIT